MAPGKGAIVFLFHRCDNCVCHFLRAHSCRIVSISLEVVCDVLSFFYYLCDRPFHPLCSLKLFQVPEHHHPERMKAVGLALFSPLYFGAEP